MLAMSENNKSGDATTNEEEAQKLLDRVAQIRAEVAALEGKSIEQVEEEANQEKVLRQQRQEQREEELQERQKQQKQQQRPSQSLPRGSMVQVPSTIDDMIRQAARSVERAYQDGIHKQTIRFHLIKDNDKDSITEESQWPGGARQIYREAGKPMTAALLREIRLPSSSNGNESSNNLLPPTLDAKDIWDFDGSAIHSAKAADSTVQGDIQALVFPNTDTKYIQDIQDLANEMKSSDLLLLVNPFWRNVDSWSFNLLAPNAKQKAQKVIFDQGYDVTYHFMIFQVRGEKCAAIKAYPYDWEIFVFLEDEDESTYWGAGVGEQAIRLGTISEKPTSAIITEMINERPEFKETKTMRQMKKTFRK